MFKSYKPELVPEKISAIGIGSAWKALPNEFLHGFADAKSRAALQETSRKMSQNFKWCTTTVSCWLKSEKLINWEIRMFEEKESYIGNKLFFLLLQGSVSGRRKESVLPSVEYFNIGSRIFKEKSTTSIFDVCKWVKREFIKNILFSFVKINN